MALELDLDTEKSPEKSPDAKAKKNLKSDVFINHNANCYVCGLAIGKAAKHTYKTSTYKAGGIFDGKKVEVENHLAMHLYCYEAWVKVAP